MKNCNYLGMKGIKCIVFWINWRDDGEEPVKLNEFLRKNDSKVLSVQPIGKGEYTSEVLVTYISE